MGTQQSRHGAQAISFGNFSSLNVIHREGVKKKSCNC